MSFEKEHITELLARAEKAEVALAAASELNEVEGDQ